MNNYTTILYPLLRKNYNTDLKVENYPYSWTLNLKSTQSIGKIQKYLLRLSDLLRPHPTTKKVVRSFRNHISNGYLLLGHDTPWKTRIKFYHWKAVGDVFCTSKRKRKEKNFLPKRHPLNTPRDFILDSLALRRGNPESWILKELPWISRGRRSLSILTVIHRDGQIQWSLKIKSFLLESVLRYISGHRSLKSPQKGTLGVKRQPILSSVTTPNEYIRKKEENSYPHYRRFVKFIASTLTLSR